MRQLREWNRLSVMRWTRVRARGQNNNSGEYVFSVGGEAIGAVLDNATLNSLEAEVIRGFTRMIGYTRTAAGLGPNDRMMVSVNDGTRATNTGLMRARSMNGREVVNTVRNALSSLEAFQMRGLKVTIKYAKVLRTGGDPSYHEGQTFEAFVKHKKCCVYLQVNKERDCYFQCVVLAKTQEYAKAVKSDAYRRREAVPYREQFGMQRSLSGVTLNDVAECDRRFSLNTYIIEFGTMRFIHTPVRDEGRIDMFLLHDGNGHFAFVNPRHVGALWGKRKFCFKCNKGYQDARHRCISTCLACRREHCEGAGAPLNCMNTRCEDCNMLFFNRDCMQSHVSKGKEGECWKVERKCRWCHEIIDSKLYLRKKIKHRCHYYMCRNCEDYVPQEGHQCHHQRLTKDKLEAPTDKYVFYDYECFVEEDKDHEPAMVVAMYYTGSTPYVFHDHDAWISWVFQPKHIDYTFIAHNGGRYDVHFIKAAMLKRGISSYDVVNGGTIMYIKTKKLRIRFVDSYRFITCSLRRFPKTFGITEQSKGFFPYTFFTKANVQYHGPLPDAAYFEFDRMKGAERREAMEWYERHKEEPYNLLDKCLEYCKSDVALLREGCRVFRSLFLDITHNEVDVFQYITIASVCMRIYQRFHMPSGAIAVLPPQDGCKARLQWQRAMEAKGGAYVDGVMTVDGEQSVFLECLDHGCPKCFNPFSLHPTSFKRMSLLRYDSRKKTQGYTVMRECEWMKKRGQFGMKADSCRDDPDRPLSMRDGFFGGRTEPVKLVVENGQRLHYYDFTSLYPAIQYGWQRGFTPETYDTTKYTSEYPIGHPIRITEAFLPLEHYFGFVKCKIACPETELYHPVLPERRDGKLLFDLTTKTGTWTTVEVLKAIEMGYTVEEVYEVVHFPERSGDLFKSYVQEFLKIKQQAAGWTKIGCTTEEEKQEYLRAYAEQQGITLDPTKIEGYNPGLYFIAKVCLNSLWGKYAQRDNFTNTQDTFTELEFAALVESDRYEILDILMHDHRCRTVTYRLREDCRRGSRYTNIAIAAFTTAYARLRLYEVLDYLGEGVCYMDTDSVIFIEDPEKPIKLGPYLGDLTSELRAGDHITSFVSTGPKCYSYRTLLGEEVTKVKGFTLNHANSVRLNHDTLRALLKGAEDEDVITTDNLQFEISERHTITSHMNEKRFRFTFDKRDILELSGGVQDTVPKKIKI